MSQDKTTGTGADVPYFFESLLPDLHEWAGRMGKVLESHDAAPLSATTRCGDPSSGRRVPGS
ncbi:hypothetical protein J2T21_000303 [Paeniglutamicibacter psychrophenolicus]|nr:hypothetical protein [Paeniglutamicibacter psychrophenolicus]